MGPVFNQQNCTCCWAVVAKTLLEFHHKRRTGESVSLSVQQLVDCCKKEKKTCYLHSYNKALNWIISNGIATEEAYGAYIGGKSECKMDAAPFMKIDRYEKIPDEYMFDEHEIEVIKALKNGPVAAALPPHLKSLKKLKAGEIYKGPQDVNELYNAGGHAVLIVGYGTDSDGVNYWEIMNSWGDDWADEGYGKIIRSSSVPTGYNPLEALISRCTYIKA